MSSRTETEVAQEDQLATQPNLDCDDVAFLSPTSRRLLFAIHPIVLCVLLAALSLPMFASQLTVGIIENLTEGAFGVKDQTIGIAHSLMALTLI